MRRNYSVFFLILSFIVSFGVLLGNSKLNGATAKAEETAVISGISGKSFVLMDADSETVIFAENETEQRPIASMCKIMMLLLCYEKAEKQGISFEDKITVSETAAGMGGSQVFLEANAEYSVGDLLKSITVASANDACVAMAEYFSGSEEIFVAEMNEKAKELGMENTVFVNCTGLPKVGQYSCAKDVAIMFRELIKHKEYFTFSTIWTDQISHPDNRVTEISNTNKLVRFYDGCDGGKTGYTKEAGHCLCASAKRNDMRLISVVISAPDSKARFKAVSSMFNYGFANYTNKLIVDASSPLDFKVGVSGGKQSDCIAFPERSLYLFSKKNQDRNIEMNFTVKDNLKAPIVKGDKLGVLSIYENGVEIDSVNVFSGEDIGKKSYFDNVSDVIENWGIAGNSEK